jgi:hypothetical protein
MGGESAHGAEIAVTEASEEQIASARGSEAVVESTPHDDERELEEEGETGASEPAGLAEVADHSAGEGPPAVEEVLADVIEQALTKSEVTPAPPEEASESVGGTPEIDAASAVDTEASEVTPLPLLDANETEAETHEALPDITADRIPTSGDEAHAESEAPVPPENARSETGESDAAGLSFVEASDGFAVQTTSEETSAGGCIELPVIGDFAAAVAGVPPESVTSSEAPVHQTADSEQVVFSGASFETVTADSAVSGEEGVALASSADVGPMASDVTGDETVHIETEDAMSSHGLTEEAIEQGSEVIAKTPPPDTAGDEEELVDAEEDGDTQRSSRPDDETTEDAGDVSPPETTEIPLSPSSPVEGETANGVHTPAEAPEVGTVALESVSQQANDGVQPASEVEPGFRPLPPTPDALSGDTESVPCKRLNSTPRDPQKGPGLRV